MNLVEATLRRVSDDLVAIGVSWAVVGGFAVSARAEPRFTRDVDVAVAVSGDDQAESIIHHLTARGYRLVALTEQDAVDRLATARVVPPGTGRIVVDIMFASSGIETRDCRSGGHRAKHRRDQRSWLRSRARP